MVDFKKQLSKKAISAPIDPIALYDSLDRAHDKGPLRPAQQAVLESWFNDHKGQRDAIVKLHTGQGKTLVGLLMLQSQLNAKKGPALYLCPNNYLVEQACDQASQFGIRTCIVDGDLPDEFVNGDRILVTSVQMLFNGLTKFKLFKKSLHVSTILMDDAHACSDAIRQATKIRISHEEETYHLLHTIFSNSLESQGCGTYADLCNRKRDALLPVPYWSWLEHESEVAKILSSGSDSKSIKFAWPLLKDILGYCQCIFSGVALEIEPFVPPLHAFGSYHNAEHRIFMSATVTDDAFLVKGLQLSPETISNPLTFSREKWSGEKMVLIPSLIDKTLTRESVVEKLAPKNENRKFGIVVLSPGFEWTKDWNGYGAIIAKTETVASIVKELQKGHCESTVVLANRYDGIDLPDKSCRILIFDNKPFSESLIDLYEEECRPNSAATFMRTLRTVEQGMGRSVRGEKDYSVIIVLGQSLVRLLREKSSRAYLSPQMAMQIDIGLELVEFAKQDIKEGSDPYKAFIGLINQCLRRDEGWKEFYKEKMDEIRPAGVRKNILNCYASELNAELRYQKGDYDSASDILQSLIDTDQYAKEDRDWYLQTIARFKYKNSRSESVKLQSVAYNANRALLRPYDGVTVSRLKLVSHGRVERLLKWMKQFASYEEMDITIADILEHLNFGIKADNFEKALNELSYALGFAGERPDKEWKEGPDNLWALNDSQYILWECKDEVKVERSEINKSEAEQMNRSCAWFEKHYKGMNARNIIIHPAKNVASSAAFTHSVNVMQVSNLKKLTKNVRSFFNSFAVVDFNDLSPSHVQELINSHDLSVEAIIKEYSVATRDRK